MKELEDLLKELILIVEKDNRNRTKEFSPKRKFVKNYLKTLIKEFEVDYTYTENKFIYFKMKDINKKYDLEELKTMIELSKGTK